VIADNLSAHKTKQVSEFLDRHPNLHLHFTPHPGSTRLSYRPRRLHLRLRPVAKADAIHPPVQQGSQNHKVALP
jgi:hypothetical protein